MNLDELADKLESVDPLKLLKDIKNRILEYSPGKKTKVIKVNDDGSFSLEYDDFDQESFTEYIKNYLQKRMKEEFD